MDLCRVRVVDTQDRDLKWSRFMDYYVIAFLFTFITMAIVFGIWFLIIIWPPF